MLKSLIYKTFLKIKNFCIFSPIVVVLDRQFQCLKNQWLKFCYYCMWQWLQIAQHPHGTYIKKRRVWFPTIGQQHKRNKNGINPLDVVIKNRMEMYVQPLGRRGEWVGVISEKRTLFLSGGTEGVWARLLTGTATPSHPYQIIVC